MPRMDHEHPAYHPAHLFTLRLWWEELGDGAAEWRGQVRSVETGEIHYFREWPALIELLRVMLPASLDGMRDHEARNDRPDL